jgi:hypothetical protein
LPTSTFLPFHNNSYQYITLDFFRARGHLRLFINLTPFYPPLLSKERGKEKKEGLAPLLDALKQESQREAKPLL